MDELILRELPTAASDAKELAQIIDVWLARHVPGPDLGHEFGFAAGPVR